MSAELGTLLQTLLKLLGSGSSTPETPAGSF